MSARGADQVKSVPVDAGNAAADRWVVERYGERYLFLGPNSSMLFTSHSAKTWRTAVDAAREKWRRMDSVTRGLWYGPTGRYADPGTAA